MAKLNCSNLFFKFHRSMFLSRKLFSNRMTYASFKKILYFENFDGLRAIAALLVLFFHDDNYHLIPWGFAGVYIFFPLSGFLITTKLLREEETLFTVNLTKFYIHRIFRIWPNYFLFIILMSVASYYQGTFNKYIFPALWQTLLMMNELTPSSYLDNTWTLGIEEKFYLLWPILAFIFIKPLKYCAIKRTVLALVLFLISLVCIPLTTGNGFYHTGWSSGYASILLGCISALLLHSEKIFRKIAFLFTLGFSIIIFTLLLVYSLNLLTIIDYIGVYLPNWSIGLSEVIYSFLALLFMLTVIPNSIFSILHSFLFRWLGKRSYALYIFERYCGAILYSFISFIFISSSKTWGLYLIIMSIFWSHLIYECVEKPFVYLGRRVAKSIKNHAYS